MKLTDRACKHAEVREKAYKLTDGHGLYLHVMPTGSKLWRFKYHFLGKERVLSLGSYPLVPLVEAREKREAARKQIRDGNDPGFIRKEEKAKALAASQNTFEAIARAWHENQKNGWTVQYGKNLLHRLEQDIFPEIGKMPITSIRPLNILGALKKVEARGAHEIARRLLANCRLIFGYAVIHGHIESNPAADLAQGLKPYKKGHYRAMDGKDLPDFLRAIERNDARLFDHTRLALRLMVLTFVRTSELIKAKWGEINFQDARWEIPAERMKMRKPHIVPLSRQSLMILQELKNLAGNREYIFPGRAYRSSFTYSLSAVDGALLDKHYQVSVER